MDWKGSSKPTSTETDPADDASDPRLVWAIAAGVVLGALVGGFFPAIGAATEIIGQIFLNLLMALVVPLVVLSIVAGITSLGGAEGLGRLGVRTFLYYATTTGLAVAVGIVVVNLVRPGVGVSPGEELPDAAYRVDPAQSRTVILEEARWSRTDYGDQYVVTLRDQDLQGHVEEMDETSVTVSFWEAPHAGDVLHLRARDGTMIPVRRDSGRLVLSEPEVADRGTGVSIALPSEPPERPDSSLSGVIRRLLVGDEEGDAQGLVPRNLFLAMARAEILPLILFAVLFGVALTAAGDTAKTVVRGIEELNEVVMRLVNWIMWLAPVGIFALLAARIAAAGGFIGFLPELRALGWYSLTVVLGLTLHATVVLPLILWLVGRRDPFAYARGLGSALLTAFSTASSSATLPVTLRATTQDNEVGTRSASFVLPLGATINMDGTALYESVAAIFIAQVYAVPLDPGTQVVIFLTATLAAIGAAGIPEAGLVTMVIVLTAAGLPLEGVGLILAVDWLLDRFRTAINVWGDGVGAAVVDRFETT